MPRNIAIPARRSSGSPVGSQMNSADSDSNDGHFGPRSDREWRRQYGPAIGAEVVQRLPCGWRRGCRSLRAKLCFDRGNVFQYWRTKLEEACVSCFAPQIPAWNDSDGEALALVFAQEHGAGLEAWQTRSHREDSSLFGRWWSSAFRLTTPIFVARGPALLFGISRWLSQHGISRKRRNNLTRVLIAVERSTQESKANSSHPSSRALDRKPAAKGQMRLRHPRALRPTPVHRKYRQLRPRIRAIA